MEAQNIKNSAMTKATFATIMFILAFCICEGQEKLIYHDIRTDMDGNILPWYDAEPAKSYDHIIELVWNFWDTIRTDLNGIPYYMNHQVWREDFNDPRGVGGDQIQMALSSWQLLHMYSGNERLKENMKFLADYYISHGLSPANAHWPNIPFPYNTLIYSGYYDGDMVIGKDYTQPDKAGSFGCELIKLYKMMSNERYPHATEKRYLEAAINIANTLAGKIKSGDENNSPWPFKVNAFNGEIGKLKSNSGDKTDAGLSSYTTNWAGAAELFHELIRLQLGDVTAYQKSLDLLLRWMKNYPMKNNKWGPFFEDVPGWSDTQINAMTWARFIMNHRDYFPSWKTDVQSIIDWVYKTLGNEKWKKSGVTVVNEQTAYQTPGNSHTSRQAADELLYASLTGNASKKEHAIRQLNWATYMVEKDGRNRYPEDENWLTDGYGDYIRHYLRAMATAPELAPGDEDHILFSSSVVQQANYKSNINKFLVPVVTVNADKAILFYTTFDHSGNEVIRLSKKPSAVYLDKEQVAENTQEQGYTWRSLETGGVLVIRRKNANRVTLLN
jgi:hypothetical protein